MVLPPFPRQEVSMKPRTLQTSSNETLGFGTGIYDFTAWEAQSGRLGVSQWWRATNGVMALDIRGAMREITRGDGVSRKPGVQAWIDYARVASSGGTRWSQQSALWHAHQVSLHGAVRSDAVMAMLGGEWAANPGEVAMGQIIVMNVDHAALENWPSDTHILGYLATAYGAYPADLISVGLGDATNYSDPNTGIGSTRIW
jgi:hypothetical protein